jgi:hypothetical protein
MHKSHAYYSKLLSTSKYKPTGILRKPPASLNNIIIDKYYSSPAYSALMQNILLNAIPEASILSPVHREGFIELGDTDIVVNNALFDTGALHGSYISQNFVYKHLDKSKPFLKSCNAVVKMADNKTSMKLENIVRLAVLFIGDDQSEYRAVIDFFVFDTSSNDIIIGLPAILRDFSVLLKEMIDNAVSNLVDYTQVCNVNLTLPWTQSVDIEAPEDMDTDLPCSFP